jgi:arabinose-5-phosphate isomerase
MNFKEFCRVLNLEGNSILDAEKRFLADPQAIASIEAAIQLILERTQNGGRAILVGVGKSGKIAAKLAATFSSTGTAALYIHPTEALHGDLGIMGENDFVIAISYTGNTEELITLLPYFEQRHAPVIALTGHPHSKLGEKSKIVINANVAEEACAHNLAPTSSTTLALAIGDALAIAVMKVRGFSAEDFAKNHPGGALGRRLQLRVNDLMHRLPQIPTVAENTTVDQVLDLSTNYRLGAVLVTKAGKLAGIITDGDIRRALKEREKFFTLTARDMMTQNPTVVGPDFLAYDALRLMEERESQIAVLPVVDSDGNVLGLLRIHDLVQTF